MEKTLEINFLWKSLSEKSSEMLQKMGKIPSYSFNGYFIGPGLNMNTGTYENCWSILLLHVLDVVC